MAKSRTTSRFSRLTVTVVLLFLAAGGLAALAGSAKRSRPSGSGSGGSSKASAATAGPSRPGSSSGGGTTSVSGRASYGYGGGGYHHGGYSYYPGGWYGGYGGYGWYGGFGWPYGYGWYGPYGYGWHRPYAGPAYRMVTVAVSPDRNAPAVLETDVYPKKAHVLLNGDDLGKVKYFNGNWDRLPLPAGQHKLVFIAKGYRTLRVELEAEAGRFYRLDYRMQKGEGEDPRSMRLPRSAPSAAVGEKTAPMETVAADRGGLSRGLLRLRVTPADAAVYLDGEFLGKGEELARLHGALPVAAGVHRLEIVRPGFVSRTVEVDVPDGGDPVRIELDLDRE